MTLRGHPWHGPTVSKSESGERVPSLTELLDLADIFEVDPALLYDASPPTARTDVAATLDEVRQTAAQVEADGSRLEATSSCEMLRQHRGSVDRLMRSVDRVEDLLGPGPTTPATRTGGSPGRPHPVGRPPPRHRERHPTVDAWPAEGFDTGPGEPWGIYVTIR